jgi:hypothetical protein
MDKKCRCSAGVKRCRIGAEESAEVVIGGSAGADVGEVQMCRCAEVQRYSVAEVQVLRCSRSAEEFAEVVIGSAGADVQMCRGAGVQMVCRWCADGVQMVCRWCADGVQRCRGAEVQRCRCADVQMCRC